VVNQAGGAAGGRVSRANSDTKYDTKKDEQYGFNSVPLDIWG